MNIIKRLAVKAIFSKEQRAVIAQQPLTVNTSIVSTEM